MHDTVRKARACIEQRGRQLIHAFVQNRKNANRKRKMRNLVKFINCFHRLIEFVARGFFILVAYISGPAKSQPPISDPLLLHSATTLAKKIRNRELSSEEVVKSYIKRIEEIQPILNCVCEGRFEEALKDARECDELLKSPDCPSNDELARDKPFLGVPFSTKDIIAVKGMKLTAGLVVRKDYRSDKDADCIRLLREAGAIPIATTNVSEVGMWWESSNYVYGTSNNPYNTRHIVGGSSGGEGCIQAAAGSAFGIGSDIGGSIRMPSFFNGIFGHKPSKGVVSNVGTYPQVETKEQEDLLSAGPMCRFAEDLIPLLKVIAGKNADFLNLDSKVDITKLKIFYMEDDGGESIFVSSVDPEIKEAMRKVIFYFDEAYNIKAKKVNFRQFKKTLALWFALISSEPEKDFSFELSDRKYRKNLFWEFFKWFTRTSDHTFIALVTALIERFTNDHGSEAQTKLRQEIQELREEFKDMLGDDGVFLYPTHPTAAPFHNEPLFKPLNYSYTAIFNVTHSPVTACPLGLNKQGLPIGIQVVAGHNQDRLTLAVAEELQRSFGGWVSPPFVE